MSYRGYREATYIINGSLRRWLTIDHDHGFSGSATSDRSASRRVAGADCDT